MKFLLFFLLALAAAAPAFAGGSYQAGAQTLHVNDPEPTLIEALGEPARKVSIDNSRGDHLGDYYYYTIDKKTVRFMVAKDRITEIYEMRP